MQEARYYHTLTDGRVQCDLCLHGCTLADGQYGRCRNRANNGGRLYNEVYGHPCALFDDPIEKKHYCISCRAHAASRYHARDAICAAGTVRIIKYPKALPSTSKDIHRCRHRPLSTSVAAYPPSPTLTPSLSPILNTSST